ncbi:MAG: cytidylate kinase-like family protein [Verrucomicrobiota bacterium]
MMHSQHIDQCTSFIHCHMGAPARPGSYVDARSRRSGITISRQSGCGAHAVAERVAARLQAECPEDAPPWTIYDRNLVEKVLEEHQLPGHIARHMPEDRIHSFDDIMDQLFGLHPPLDTLVQQITETILHLAERGHVILVGRGAHLVTATMPRFLHVRLVGSVAQRIRHMQQFEGLDNRAAMERIQREDRGRERYLRTYFGKNIEDPSLYHLVLNTDLVSVDETADLIVSLARPRLKQAAV